MTQAKPGDAQKPQAGPQNSSPKSKPEAVALAPSASPKSSAQPAPERAPDHLPWCDVCRGKRWLRAPATVPPQAEPYLPCPACGVVAQRRIAQLDAFSSRRGRALQQRFSNFALDGPARSATEAFNAALLFARQPEGRWLVMYGPKGNGKSHLASAIANYLIEEKRVPVLFLTAPDLLNSLRQSLNEEGNYYALLNVACEAPVLILDDLGAERLSDWADEILFLVIDRRYRLELSTVVVTNCQLHDLPSRLYSRLSDTRLCTIVFNPAPDFRVGDGTVTI